ncbi:MAG TPA: hypothetical protein VFI38_05390 [Candidatus Acidoferrum sp.]|nr:hypothetical protein [Candidatus Acidoferrum sp.]
MKITPDQAPGAPEPPSAATNQANSQRVSTTSTTASTVEKASAAAETAIVTPAQRQTDISFRRDSNGRIYYVLSDAHSGQEIVELPAKEVRAAGQGIEEFLKKQEESKPTPHVEIKA